MLNNRKIQEILRQWKYECRITHTILFRYTSDEILKIYTDKPGIMIGLHGIIVDKYTQIFKSYDKYFEKIEFVETSGIA